MTTRNSPRTHWDDEHQVPAYPSTGWTLTVTEVQSGPDHGRWVPCVVLWLDPAHMTEVLSATGCATAQPPAPQPPDLPQDGEPWDEDDLEWLDRFAVPIVEPGAYEVLSARRAGTPPLVRCYLPGDPEDSTRLDLPEGPVIAVDVPAAAALTAALANHNDEHGWNLPVLLAPAGTPRLRAGSPLPPGAAVMALAIDLPPLAEDTEGSSAFPPGLLGDPLDELAETAHSHGHGHGPSGFEAAQVAASSTLWEIVAGLCAGAPVATRRLLDLAEEIDAAATALIERQPSMPESEVEFAQLLVREATEHPDGPLLVAVQVARRWQGMAAALLDRRGITDPVRPDLEQMRAALSRGGAGALVARTGVLDRLDPAAWQVLAADDLEAMPERTPERAAEGAVKMEHIVSVAIAQVAIRLSAVEANPAAFLVEAAEMPPEVDPAWPVLTLARDVAAHDTTVLRALLGNDPDNQFDPGYLHGLLHSIQHVLDNEPRVESYVQALATERPTPGNREAAELLAAIRGGDACGLLEERPYSDLADSVCRLLPVMVDGMIATVTVDEGSEQWVAVREQALHALLHVHLD